MSTRPPSRTPNWLPYAGLIVAIVGAVFQSGVMSSRIDANSHRIDRLEASDSLQSEKLDTINTRGARVEAKIDLLVPTKAKESDQ